MAAEVAERVDPRLEAALEALRKIDALQPRIGWLAIGHHAKRIAEEALSTIKGNDHA